ncbi:MAG: peptidylprolyl isomerase [Planctomyces sp.]|nr:peptidylprolyl isomerase [Planctomyces sp.]
MQGIIGHAAAFALIAAAGATPLRAQPPEPEVRRLLVLRGLDPESAAAQQSDAAEDVVDRRLLREFLTKQKVDVPDELIDGQWARLQLAAERQGLDLSAELGRLGISEQELRQDMWLPLAWTLYVRRTVTDDQLREHFEAQRRRFDGTTRQVRHLVVQLSSDASPGDWDAAVKRLAELRTDVLAERTTFVDAVRKHSTSPTRESGGDLGFIHPRGDLPRAVAEAAFAIAVGDISEPVRSPFGVHLVLVERERPGELSLEDARPDVYESLAGAMWSERTAALRQSAGLKPRGTAAPGSAAQVRP